MMGKQAIHGVVSTPALACGASVRARKTLALLNHHLKPRGIHGLEKSNDSHHRRDRFVRQEIYKDRAGGKAAEEDHHLQP